MAFIELTNSDKRVLVDDDMYEKLNKHKWHLQKGTDYAVKPLYEKGIALTISIHRLILGLSAGDKKCVDHINLNCLDNRRINLRICTHSQNGCNKGLTKSNTSGYKGVSWSKGNKAWEVKIRKNYKYIFIGYYKNVIDAAKAYNKAAIKYHGEFAWLNKIT